MRKKILHLIAIFIIIILCLLFSNTVIAYNEQDIIREGDNLKFHGDIEGHKNVTETLDCYNFAIMISNNNGTTNTAIGTSSKDLKYDSTYHNFRYRFISIGAEKLIGAKLLNKKNSTTIIQNNFNSPIYNKSFGCIAHANSNGVGDSCYTITTVIDISGNDKDGVFLQVMNNNRESSKITNTSKYENISFIYNLSRAIHLNDEKGTQASVDNSGTGMWNVYKNAVNYYLGQGIAEGYIDANSVYEQGYDDDENSSGMTAQDFYKELYGDGQDADDSQVKKAVEYVEISKVKTNNEPEEKKQLTINSNDYTEVGPFQLNFNKENGIRNIMLTEKGNEKNIYSENFYTNHTYSKEESEKIQKVKFYWRKANESEWKEFNNNKENSIPANTNFYLAVIPPDDKEEYDIIFEQETFGFYKARMVLLETSGSQQWGAYTSEDEITQIGGKVTYTIKRKLDGKIVIKKLSASNNTTAIKGVKLKIYGKLADGTEGWVKSEGTLDRNFIYSNTWETGTDRKCKH